MKKNKPEFVPEIRYSLNKSYKRKLLEAILVSSISEKSFRFPTIKEFILSELVNATIEYIDGNAGKIFYQDFRMRDDFLDEIYNYLEDEIKISHKEKLSNNIKTAIKELCQPYTVFSGFDKPHYHTELFDIFNIISGDKTVFYTTMFSLPQEVLIRANKELSSFSRPEKNDINGIGKLMRKYIDNDLGYIANHYFW